MFGWSRLRGWFAPDPDADPDFRREREWYDAFHPEPVEPWSQFLYDYARRKYEELEAAHARIEEKAEANLRTAAVLAGLVIAAVAQWRLTPVWPAVLSVGILALSMILGLAARRPMKRASPTTARYVLDGVAKTDAPMEWLAAGLHRTTAEFKVIYKAKAGLLDGSFFLLAIGVVAAASILFLAPASGPAALP